MSLSAGAIGTSQLSHAADAEAAPTLNTLLLPEHYKIFEGGRAIFALEGGEQLSLTSDQYVLLDGGLLLVVDELVQNTIANMPVRGSLRTQLPTEVEPVRNQDGAIVEVSSTQPLWSGDVSRPGLFEKIDLHTYELAQNAGSDAADVVSSLDDSGGLSLLKGASLLALSVGLFGLLPREDEDDGSSTGGGSGGGGSGSGGTTFSGTVIKGPLVNAFVFLDENGNGLFDAGEPNFTTSSTGGFSISSSAANPKLIVTTNDQTIDTTTGTVLSGMTFKAPTGASVVSPLTTMMEETGLSVAQIKSVLGLPASVNPLTFNPYAPGVNTADALAAEQASAQTMATLAAFAAAAAGTGISQQDAFAAALSALSTVMQSKSSSGASLDLSDATDLAAVQTAFTTAVAAIPSVTGAQTTAMAGIIGDATTAIQNVNNKIASITNTDLSDAANGNIFGLLQVLQDQVEKAAEDETATPGSGTIGFTDPTAVDNAATNSPPTDIDLSASSISEDASSLVVGVLTTTDDTTNDFNFTYEIAEIEGSTDHTAFTIDQTNGELKFVSQPDFETKSSYTITIKATDGGGKSFSETFTITVTDANDTPVFDPAAAFSTPENRLGTGVTPIATDQDGDTLSYSIVGGADDDKFELDGTTGELKFKVAPNFEANGSANGDNDYIVQIRADDGNGGTATQTFTISVTDANDPPVFTSSASHSVQENQSDTGYTPVAVHPQGLSFTFSIGGGADADKFELVGGVLQFKDAHIPDYENPTDSDGNRIYDVQIRATDDGGLTATRDVSITVTDVVNEHDPVFTSGTNFSAEENQLQTGYTPAATDADGDTVSFSINGGADAGKFSWDDVTGALVFRTAPDYENPTDSGGDRTYNVQILASDGAGRSATQNVSVTVTDVVDETAPTATITNSLVQVAPGGTLSPIALSNFASFSDAPPGTIASVTASGAGTIALTPPTTAGNLAGIYVGVTTDGSTWTWTSTTATLTLVATDNGGLTTTTSLAVAEQLSLDETDLSSEAASYTVNGSAADDTVNLGSTNSLAHEETAAAHTVDINLADGTNHFEADYVGYGAGEVFSYSGGSGTDTAIVHGQIAANDGIATFTMGDGTNSLQLLVDQIRLAKTLGAGSHETTSVFTYNGGADADTVTIRNTWNGAADNYIAQDGDVYFNMGNGTNALIFDTQDLIYFSLFDGTFTYAGGTGSDTVDLSANARVNPGTIVDFGADGAADSLTAGRLDTGFVIRNLNPDEDSIRLRIEGFAPTSYDITMNGADADVTYVLNGATRGFTAEDVTLTDDDIQISGEYLIVGVGTAANQPPTITSGGTAIAAENQVTTSYTPAATDPENDSMSFSIIGGADADLFELDGVSGVLKFKAAPDFEAQGSADNDNVYEVQIQASDGNGGTDTQTVNVTVTDENEGPDFTIISSFSAAENQIDTGYTPSATDEDGDTITYSISGGADSGDFELVGSALRFKVAPDFENPTDASSPPDNVYEVQIQADDGNGGTATQAANIAVTNVNEVPSFTSGTTFNAAENQLETGYTPAATDPENDSVTFTINGGADADKFELVGGALKFKAAPAFETPGSADNDNVYEVQTQASDGNGGTATQAVVVTVTDNDPLASISQGGTTTLLPTPFILDVGTPNEVQALTDVLVIGSLGDDTIMLDNQEGAGEGNTATFDMSGGGNNQLLSAPYNDNLIYNFGEEGTLQYIGGPGNDTIDFSSANTLGVQGLFDFDLSLGGDNIFRANTDTLSAGDFRYVGGAGSDELSLGALFAHEGDDNSVIIDMSRGGTNALVFGQRSVTGDIAFQYIGGPDQDTVEFKDSSLTLINSDFVVEDLGGRMTANFDMSLGGTNTLILGMDAGRNFTSSTAATLVNFISYLGGDGPDTIKLGDQVIESGGKLTIDMRAGGTNIVASTNSVSGSGAASVAAAGTLHYYGGDGSDSLTFGDDLAGWGGGDATFDMRAGGVNILQTGISLALSPGSQFTYLGGSQTDTLSIGSYAARMGGKVEIDLSDGGDNHVSFGSTSFLDLREQSEFAVVSNLEITGGPGADTITFGDNSLEGTASFDMTAGGSNRLTVGRDAGSGGGTLTYSGGSGPDELRFGDNAALDGSFSLDLGGDSATDTVAFEGYVGAAGGDGGVQIQNFNVFDDLLVVARSFSVFTDSSPQGTITGIEMADQYGTINFTGLTGVSYTDFVAAITIS